MLFLTLVSFVWAFSYGLIKGKLTGIDPFAVATIRLALALMVFLPFLRWRGLTAGKALRLAGVGAVQFGVMYLLYQSSYTYLPSYAVVLFTLTTPLYVTLLDALVERRVESRFFLAAALAVVGAAAVVFSGTFSAALLKGFLMMQASNLCFAAGQIAWRRWRTAADGTGSDASVFALPYAGAVAACVVGSLFTTDWTALHLTGTQWLVLLYLGAFSSGVCFFWWNLGAKRVNAGTLAVFNNAKVPLGVACSLLFWGESADVPRLLIGGVLMGAGLWVAERKAKTRAA